MLRRRRSPLLGRASAPSLALALCSALAACSGDPTQLVVLIDSDYDVPAQLSKVRIRVRDDAEAVRAETTVGVVTGTLEPGAGEARLPFSLGVLPRDGDPSLQVIIDVDALDAGGRVLSSTRRIVPRMIEGKILLLEIFLARRCATEPACRTDQTCTEHGCFTPMVDPSALDVLAPGEETTKDAAPRADAGRDGSTEPRPDAGPSDAMAADTAGTTDATLVPDAEPDAMPGDAPGADGPAGDGSPHDASEPDAAGTGDAAPGADAEASDAIPGPADATLADAITGEPDAASTDATPLDAIPGAADATSADASAPDALETDALPADAPVIDSGATDAGFTDNGVADLGVPDSGLPDATPTDAFPSACTRIRPILVSVSQGGAARAGLLPSISGDGRLVAFQSSADDLVPGDTNNAADGFVRDWFTGAAERVTLSSDEAQSSGPSTNLTISQDGRYVAFLSTNLPPQNDGRPHVYLRDRLLGTTTLVSSGPNGVANAASSNPRISANGRFVLFTSAATNLVVPDANAGALDAFLFDSQSGTIELVSRSGGLPGTQVAAGATGTGLSADARYVAFMTTQSLNAQDTNGQADIYLRDRTTGSVAFASLNPMPPMGMPMNFPQGVRTDSLGAAVVSANGLSVGVHERFRGHIFIRDHLAGVSDNITVSAPDPIADPASVAFSTDGTIVAFETAAAFSGDNNNVRDVYLRRRTQGGGTQVRVSVDQNGSQVAAQSGSPSVSANGWFVAFSSSGALAPGTTAGTERVWVAADCP